ncbi:MAG: hypothetical protein P4L87_24725, partial [Formivibrio sp.]|nr:hypothetical protein [Formivibrio sp.]
MKTIGGVFFLAVMCFSQSLLYAQTAVELVAGSQGLQLVPYGNLPPFGTYWEAMPGGVFAPLPTQPVNPTMPVYAITSDIFLVDATEGQALANSALQAEEIAVVNLIDNVQSAAANEQVRTLARAMGLHVPEDDNGSLTDSSAFTVDTNGLWLEITNVSNGWSYLNLHNGTNQVYSIFGTTNLMTPWKVETEVWPTDTNCMPFAVQNLNRQDLFLRAQDWTGVTSGTNTVPDWWLWAYYQTTALSDSSLDTYGHTLLHDYSVGRDPNVIEYNLLFPSTYVQSSFVTGSLQVMAGVPYYEAILVNDTNLADADWQPFTTTNVSLRLDGGNGVYDVWLGLRGWLPDAHQTWQEARFTLYSAPLTLTLDQPTTFMANKSTIQLLGHSRATLASL